MTMGLTKGKNVTVFGNVVIAGEVILQWTVNPAQMIV